MGIFITLFNETIFKPILNFLVAVINVMPGHDLGFAIIVVTLLIRFALYPLSYKALKSQRKLTELQPKIKEIQKKHKDDREAQSKAIMQFYKENNINPFAGCVPFLIQLPIIIGLYRVFLIDMRPESLEGLYSFVNVPQNIHTMFLGMVDLTTPSLVLALLAGGAQFVLSKVTFSQRKKKGAQSNSGLQGMMGKQMMYVLPLVTVFIARSFPAGLVLYWFTTTVFSFGQQLIVNRVLASEDTEDDKETPKPQKKKKSKASSDKKNKKA